MISCDEAATICHKNQYREASLAERLRLWAHLVVCRQCARFSRKNSRLTDLCNQASLHVLPEEEKEKLKRRLEKEQGQDPTS